MAILFCFASCDNGSTSSSSEKNPEILVSYELNGDAICLYDNNTFVITLKDNAGTISGTYSNLTSGHKLMVTKANGDIAKSGDILRLSLADGKVNVAYSDITRYSTGDGGKVTEGTTPTTPSGSQGSEGQDSDTGYTLGDAPNGNRLSEDYFTFKDCDDGIYLECTAPAGTWQTRVYIDGIGQVAEEIQYNDKKNRGNFFYPFLDSGKEYTIRVVFLRDEDKDDDGFVIDYINGDGVVGWFETKVKAGAKSKGEVCVADSGEIELKPNGDFKFTKRPTFKNENLLPEDWMINIGLVEGVSWMHEGRKTKWSGVVDIPQKELTQTRNLYTSCSWKSENLKIQFICHRPILYYEYDGKKYRYQWDGPAVDTPGIKTEEELWADIDIKNAADVAKIQGTWTENGEWDDTESHYVNVHTVYTETLAIDGNNVKSNWSYTQTKLNGSAFTKEELLENKWAYSDSSENWKLYKNCTLSNDGKTLVEKYENIKQTLSEYFADRKYDDGYTKHYDLKLFDDSLLRIIWSGTDSDGEDYSYWNDYTKQ